MAHAVEPPGPALDRRTAQARTLALALTALALVPAALALLRLLEHDEWATGARQVAWTGPTGEPLAADELGCDGDIGMTTLVDGDAVWTTCTQPVAAHAGALARIDVAQERARLAWPMPADLPLGHTVGLLPGRAGLVFVYRTPDQVLAVGVAGADGWTLPPRALPGGGEAQLLGLVDRDPPEAIVRTGESTVTLAFARVALGGAARAIDGRALCVGEPPCLVVAATAERDALRFVLSEDYATLWSVTEDGRRQALGEAAGVYSLDLSVAGLVPPGLSTGRLTARGTIGPAPLPPPGWAERSTEVPGHLAVHGAGFAPVPSFLSEAGTAVPLGDGWLILDRRELGARPGWAASDELLVLARAGEHEVHVVARLPGYACGELTNPAVIEHADDFTLVASNGCHLAVDRDLERRDPLGPLEHLLRRGSWFLDHREWHVVVLFGWSLGGLAPLFGLGLALGALRRRRGRGRRGPSATASPWPTLATASAIQIFLGGLALAQVWAYLR